MKSNSQIHAWVKIFKQEPNFPKLSRKLVFRRILAIVFVLGCITTVTIAIWYSYSEETVDWFLNLDAMRFDPKIYRINIISIDEVSGKAILNAELVINRLSFVSTAKAKGPINGAFLLNDLDIRSGPLHLSDLASQFEAMGFLVLNSLTNRPVSSSSTSEFQSELPVMSQVEFTMLGQPKFYPFDKYYILGYASADVIASADKKEFFSVDDNHTEIYLKAPNLVMRGASNSELSGLTRMELSPEGTKVHRDFLKNNAVSRQKIFAVMLQRPLFLRVLTIFLLLVTLGSAVYYVVVSEVKTFALQALGYFVGLWAIRQMLVSGGPRTFTAVDYVVLFLYAALAATLIAKGLWIKTT